MTSYQVWSRRGPPFVGLALPASWNIHLSLPFPESGRAKNYGETNVEEAICASKKAIAVLCTSSAQALLSEMHDAQNGRIWLVHGS